jgi:hypothetical protein
MKISPTPHINKNNVEIPMLLFVFIEFMACGNPQKANNKDPKMPIKLITYSPY